MWDTCEDSRVRAQESWVRWASPATSPESHGQSTPDWTTRWKPRELGDSPVTVSGRSLQGVTLVSQTGFPLREEFNEYPQQYNESDTLK